MSTENMITIGEAELEVMKAVWRAKEPISTKDVMKAVEKHGWKRTTVSTFLVRLVEKGALLAEKQGKTMYYTPVISSKEYKKTQVKHLIKNVFDGSAGELVASLFEQKALTEEEIAELRGIFETKE